MRVPFSLFVLAATVAAQGPTHTVPKNLLTRDGNSRHWIPAHAAPARAQTTYHPNEVDLPTGNITRIWLRPDSDGLAYAAHRTVVTLHMSSAGLLLPDQVDPQSFAANRGTDRRRVLNRTTIDFPAIQGSGASGNPAPWAVAIPIQPFPFVAGRGLQVEWDLEAPNGQGQFPTWFVDAQEFHHAATSGSFLRDNERNACPDRQTVHGARIGGPGQRASVWWYSGGSAGLPAAMYFGLQHATWNGLPLPVDLGPLLGATGCRVWTDLQSAVPTRTDNDGGPGRVRVDLVLPPDPQLVRLQMFTQTFVADPTVPGGIRASDRGRISVGNMPAPFYGARHLYSYQGVINDVPEFISERGPILGVD